MNIARDNPIQGLIWLSPSDMIGLVNDPEGKKDHEICINEARYLIDIGEESKILSHDLWGCMRLSASTYNNFFGEDANTAIFNYGDNLRGWGMVNNIKVPVIAFTGTKDDGIVPVMDAYKAMELLKNQLINSPRKKMVVLDEANHDFEGFGDEIVKEVLNFISKKNEAKK